MANRGALQTDTSAEWIAAALGRVLLRRWLAALWSRPVARLRRALHFALLHLPLHLRVALLLHLHGALLLHLLFARALLFLHLRLALLLCLLVTRTLLLLHLRLALLRCLLLRLLRTCALLCLGLPLLLRGTVVDLLRHAFDRPHHGQPARCRCVPLRLLGGPDHRRARQRGGFARVREARGWQFVGALWGVARLVYGCLDRVHRVLERLGRTCAARGRFAGARCHDWARRLRARRRFRGPRRGCAMHGADRGGTSGCARGRWNQLHAIIARC